ncbi:Stp1/IreP family PP2C-type Ser/Thr phosphatase, partial [Acidobacteria bacterium AH-259-D05]|nr:Stp1/IreP family PP2C-type Ser/Thr phosphatase [Acidobacteria bacterium AH-259-D05]
SWGAERGTKMESEKYQMGSLEYEYQARSDIGRVRTNNEDSLIEAPALGFFGVCDGLGGHAAGEVASSIASSTLRELVQQASESPEIVLRRGIDEANRRILSDQAENPQRQGMGTTVSSLWLMSEESGLGWIGHVGDSRIYLQRGDQFTQLTEDHSPVFRLFKQGLLNKNQMQRHPQKNLLDRSLGVLPIVEVDVFPVSFISDDLILICSDGLTDCLSDEEIRLVLNVGSIEEAADQLVLAANNKGGGDNITLVLVRISKT